MIPSFYAATPPTSVAGTMTPPSAMVSSHQRGSGNMHIPLSASQPTSASVRFSTPLPGYESEQTTRNNNFQVNFDDSTDFHSLPRNITTTFPSPIVLNNIPMFSEETPELWFKVLEAAFDEGQLFDSLSRFRYALVKLNSSQLQVIGELLYGSHEEPYKKMKKLLIDNYGTPDQQRYVMLSRMKLGNDKPSVLLRKMKSIFHGKQLNNVLIDVIRSIFLQALPSNITVHLVGDNLPLDRLAIKADAIQLELIKSSSNPFQKSSDATRENFRSSDDRYYRRPRDSSVNPNYSGSFNPDDVPGLCWYHQRFGPVQAKKCHGKPCPMFPCLNPSKKRVKWLATATSRKPQNSSSVLFVKDKVNSIDFLVDSGSMVSVLPLIAAPSQKSPVSKNLFALNNTEIKSFGNCRLNIDIGLKVGCVDWNFEVADTSVAILGADFIKHHDLLIDLSSKKLFEKNSGLSRNFLNLESSNVIKPVIVKPQCNNNESIFKQMIFQDFPNLLTFNAPATSAATKIRHEIITKGPPIRGKVRRLSPEMMNIAKTEIKKLLEAKIIRPGNSSWGSPIHLVKKREEGKFRLTVDFRAVNAVTEHDSYPLPLLNDFVNSLHGCSVFSLIDLKHAFHQVPVHHNSVAKTCTLTPFGSFVWNYLPFGLRNSAQCFQRHINQITSDFDFVFVYMDDVLIFSRDDEEHKIHLRKIFERFDKFALTINMEKSKFGVKSLDYLGHHVSEEGLTPLSDRLSAISCFPKPSTMRQLRRFLGMIAFYKKFIPNCAETLQPLYSLLSPHKYSKKPVVWNKKTDLAFKAIINKMNDPVTLAYPVQNAPTYLVTDASDLAAGAVLHQKIDGDLRPLGFFSKSFSKAQLNYSVFDKELTAVHMAIKHFRYFLEGRKFTIVTDQKSISQVILSNSKNLSPRQCRYIDFISQYSTDIIHIPGSNNVVSDCLSRTQCNALFTDLSPVSNHEIAVEQGRDSSLQQWIANNNQASGLTIENRTLHDSKSLLGDTSTGNFRPLIPQNLRRKIFDILHSLSHPGIRGTKSLVFKRFVWPGMNSDIKDWVKTCLPCQMSKIQRHNKAPLKNFQEPDDRFSHVHLDIIGPLNNSRGYTYALTIIDRYTRWGEVIPIHNIETETLMIAFLQNWVARFGCPSTITCDRGAQFTSNLWKNLCIFLGCKLSHTCAYHPASNGMIERFNKQVKTSLKTHSDIDWVSNLPWVLLGIRSTLKEDLGCSSAQLTFGTSLQLPSQFFVRTSVPDAESHFGYFHRLSKFLHSLRPTPPRPVLSQSSYIDPLLHSAKFVFVRKDASRAPLERVYTGPYKVIYRSDKYFTLLQHGSLNNVSINRLKTANLPLHCDDGSVRSTQQEDVSIKFDEMSTTSSADRAPLPLVHASPSDEMPIRKTRLGRVVRPPAILDL